MEYYRPEQVQVVFLWYYSEYSTDTLVTNNYTLIHLVEQIESHSIERFYYDAIGQTTSNFPSVGFLNGICASHLKAATNPPMYFYLNLYKSIH